MLRSFLRRWLGIDSDCFVLGQRIDGFYDLHEASYKSLEQRVSEIDRQVNTPCPPPNLKPKRKPKAKVRK